MGGSKLERFLPQNQHTQRKLLNFEIWIKVPKFDSFLPKNQRTQRKLLNFEYWISGGLRSFQKSEF